MALKNIFCVLVFLILIANFAYAADAVIAYRSDSGNGTAYPKLRFWNSSGTGTWGPEIELPDSGSDADYVIIRSSPARNKLVVITLGGDRYLDAYACTSSCTQPASWTLTTNIGQVENVANTRRFDFNFEKSTGDMVLVYSVLSSDGSRDLAYKMLPDDQTNFSGLSEYYIDDTGHAGDSDYSWVELDRKKTGTSQELALVALDSTHDDVNAWIWNGSAFGNYAEISSDISKAGNPQRREALAVKYTYISGNAMAIGGYGSSGDFNYRIWNGSVWSSVASFDSDPANGEDIEWASMKADPSSDYLQAVLQTSASDLDTAFWNGSAWFNTTDISTSLSGSGATRPADFAWNPTGSTGLLVWGESPGEMKWRTCSPECNGTIMTDTSFSSNTRFVVNSRNPTSDDYVKIIGVRIINSGNGEIGSYSWNGTNISNYGDSVITLSSGTQNVEIAFSLESQAYYDILAPQVNLVSPANSSTILGNSVNLTFNTTDDIATALNCSLFLDGILNMTNGSVANGTDTGFQVAGIPSGLHNWSVSCTDQGNNTGVSETWYFTMDSGPQVTLNAPANNSYTNSSIVSFNFTASDNFATTLNCSLYLDGSLNQYYPTVSNGTPHVFSVGPMSDGSYYWNVSCKDNSNLTGWSQTRYFTVDTTNPQLSIQHPQNITYNVWTVPLNYIASDNIGAPTCFLYIDGISYGELPGCVNATIAGFSDGAHNVTMYVNDSAGNSNSSTVSFTIDTSAPIIALNSPPEGYATNSTTVEFNFTATDNLSPTMNCSLYVDGSLLQYNPSIANNTPMIFSQLLSQGQYNWTITCTDGANNTAASETRNLTVDASAPVVSIQSPANTTYAVPDIDLNFTVTDNLGVSSCWYYLNGAGPTMLPGCANTTLNSLTNGHYNLTVFANDSADNQNSSTVFFTINVAAPPPIIIPSGDGGEDKDELNLSWEQVCPENGMLVNVRSDGSTVSGVEVRLLLQDPYYGLIDQQDSNESGQVMFNTDITGTYWIYAHGSGYYSFGPLEAEYTACEPEVTEGCDVDSDCASTETCEGGTCTQVECECGMIEDRTCVPYECCSDTECSEGEVCTGNQCVIEPGCTTDSDCADEETCSSEICIPVETGECGYVQNHSWQDYECCQDSECADYPYEKCTSHTCGPRTYTLKVLSETVTAGSEARIAVIEDDERMANARISIMSPSGKTFEGYTDENGEFVFTPDAKGTYTASAFGSDGRTLAKADVMAGEASTPCCLFSLCSFLGLSQLFGICWYWWILLLIIIAAIIILYLVYREIQKGGTKRKWKGPRGPKK